VIAALFVQECGAYYGLEGVDPWPESRDARLYAGPWPVVAHPPCERWGRYWYGGPSSKVRKVKGDDGGCFAAALAAVRKWGGVLEHPEASAAWSTFGLIAPPKGGGWVAAGDFQGWTCCVEQGHYGHRARKATWLYACHVDPAVFSWGKSAARARLEDGYHSAAERAAAKGKARSRQGHVSRLTRSERLATPPAFRDLLLSIARSARSPSAQDTKEGTDGT
jgi:hypothetical protein